MFLLHFILPRYALGRHGKREDWNKAREAGTKQESRQWNQYRVRKDTIIDFYSPPFACLTLLLSLLASPPRVPCAARLLVLSKRQTP